MFKKALFATFALSVAVSVVFGAEGSRFNVIDGEIGAKYDKLVLSDSITQETGFAVTDPHERINDAYTQRYGNPEDPDYDKEGWSENLDNLGFFPMTNDKALHDILLTDPQVAGFAPANLLIYKKRAEKKTYIGHISPETMLDIIGVKNPETREAFIEMYKPLDKWVQDNFGGIVETNMYDTLPPKPMMTFEYEFDRSGDIGEFTDEFQEKFEAAFEAKHYIIAGFKNYKERYADMDLAFEKYDAFFVYGLCHFTFSYNLFNKGRPDTGVFAPCSMYMYIEKGSNKMIIGMPRLSTWVSVMNIKDPIKIEWTKKIDMEIISIMTKLGAKEI